MKKIVFLSALLLSLFRISAQVDTIYCRNQQKLACKIAEINEYEIKYHLASMPDGPIYVINRNTVIRYCLSGGFCEIIRPDELSLETEHLEIIGNRSVIKIHPFSFVNDQLSVAYEKVIKVGMNLDVELGYSNSNINSDNGLGGSFSNIFNVGAYVKPGVKFFLGQDFSVKGLKYAHPLKGRYVKLDFAASYLSFQNLKRYEYTANGNSSITTRTITSNMNVFSYGFFVNYGRQFILGNTLTLDYYFGLGFTSLNYGYSNPAYKNISPTYQYQGGYYYNSYIEGRNVSNFHAFLRSNTSYGLSVTGGFRLGYILPEKSTKKKVRPISG